jgi:DNA-binding transcriptional regulator YiaG
LAATIQKPFGRVDQWGLVWLIKGGRIVSMSMSAAVIETPTGARQTYRRRDGAPRRVLAWESSRPKKSADRQC